MDAGRAPRLCDRTQCTRHVHNAARKGIRMSAKSFAAGIRIEHPQEMINMSQYGQREVPLLGAAAYKLTHQLSGGRGSIRSACAPEVMS